jgi:hypothetical protein
MRAILYASLLFAACSSKPTPGGVRLDQAKKALDKSGVEVKGLEDTQPQRFSALKCLAGPVAKLDVVLCEYGSPDAVVAGKKAVETWAGQSTTAVVLDNGLTVLGAADRGSADPNGKLLNQLASAYTKAH